MKSLKFNIIFFLFTSKHLKQAFPHSFLWNSSTINWVLIKSQCFAKFLINFDQPSGAQPPNACRNTQNRGDVVLSWWFNIEASYFDQINMTKNWLEYVQKNIIPTNMNVGTWPKDYTDEHERLNMTEIPMKMTEIFKCLKIIRMTNLNGWIWPK